ncbi:MAG: glycosyltransferase [Phycisphaerae bacterium]|nr:glycosyltransferase [Phycisphaerae bacterium]
MRKVCHMASGHSVYDDRIMYRELVSLANNGWDATLVGVGSQDTVCKGVKIKAVSKAKNRALRMTWQTLKVLIKSWQVDADIYHFHEPELIFAGMVLKLFKRAHVINDVHEDYTLMLFKPYIPKQLRKTVSWFLNKVENFTTKRFDAVVTPTQPITERFSKIARRTLTLYNFPTDDFMRSADRFKAGIEECIYDVVHVGALREDRLEFLLDVAAEVQKKLGNQTWGFVGMPAPLEPIAKRLAEKRGLDGITLVPKIPYPELPKILCRSKIGVNFHPLGETHTEVAIPVKIFEYLACGLPVVSTPLPLVCKLLGNVPMVKLVDDKVKDFSEAVVELLSNVDSATKMRDMAWKYSRENYSWAHEEKKLLELYEDILRDSK